MDQFSVGPAPDALSTRPEMDWSEAIARVTSEPGMIRTVFQPIVDLRRGVVCGYEMLARFAGPAAHPPDIWFREADVFGAKVELEATMLALGLEARAALPANCFITINLDPVSLAEPLVQEVLRDRAGLRNVVLELTEHSRADDEEIRRLLPPLRERGALFAIDDVGSGYSGLGGIVALRPEFVKVDRALVSGIHEEATRRELVGALGAVANRIDAWVIAEGIEEMPELEATMRLGVPLGQGYGLGRPAPAMNGPELEISPWIRRAAGVLSPPGSEPTARLWTELEPVGTRDWEAAAEARFRADPSLQHLPVVDEGGTPIGMAHRPELSGAGVLRAVLRCLPAENPAHLARRALARPVETRFDPILCCEDGGRYLGVVRVESLVESLADRYLDRPADRLSAR